MNPEPVEAWIKIVCIPDYCQSIKRLYIKRKHFMIVGSLEKKPSSKLFCNETFANI